MNFPLRWLSILVLVGCHAAAPKATVVREATVSFDANAKYATEFVKLRLVLNRAYSFEVFSTDLIRQLNGKKGTVPLEISVSDNSARLLSVDGWTIPETVRWSFGHGCGEGHPELPPCNPDGTAPIDPNPFALEGR